MKKILLLFFLLCVPVYGQKVHLITTGTLINASTQDSIMVASAIEGIPAWRSSATQDTILTKWIYMEGLNADFTVEFRYANVAGTDSVDFFIQLFRGKGTPDSTGFSRHSLVTGSTSNLNTFYNFADSTFVTKRQFTKYRFEIREGKDVQNDYIINVNHYSPLATGTPNLRDN